MIPLLFDADEQQFVTQGFGGLGQAVSMEVPWALNGKYELVMTYPVTGYRFADLAAGRLILASVGPDEPDQLFRIYRIDAPLNGLCTVYARHVAYDLMGHTLRPFEAVGAAEAAQAITSGAVVQLHQFAIAAEVSSSAAVKSPTPRSVWSMLGGQRGSMLDVFGGEWNFNRFVLTLRERLGADLGVTVRYGVNLRTLEQDTNVANTWTAVHPFWQSADGLTVVTLPEDTVSAGEFDRVHVLVADFSAEWTEPPTEEQLRSRTRRYISDNNVGVPDVGLDVSFVPLDQTEEYKGRNFLQKIHKGDTVRVEFPTAYNRDGSPRAMATATARAVETVWLPLEDKYKSIRLGKRRADFASTVAKIEKNLQWVISKTR